jgi:hypothetical protein
MDLFYLISSVIMSVGALMMLVAAFRTSVGWGIACLFVPFLVFLFLLKRWPAGRSGLAIWSFGASGLVILLLISR